MVLTASARRARWRVAGAIVTRRRRIPAWRRSAATWRGAAARRARTTTCQICTCVFGGTTTQPRLPARVCTALRWVHHRAHEATTSRTQTQATLTWPSQQQKHHIMYSVCVPKATHIRNYSVVLGRAPSLPPCTDMLSGKSAARNVLQSRCTV
jgi:hypothetical protein